MVSWKLYLSENKKRKKPNPYLNRIVDVSNRDVKDTTHSIERLLNVRIEEKDLTTKAKSLLSNKDKLKLFIDKMIKQAMQKFIVKYKDKSNVYGVKSKSTNIGIIVNWRPYLERTNDNTNHAWIVTVLPIKRNLKFKQVKDVILVESVDKKEIKIKEIVEVD